MTETPTDPPKPPAQLEYRSPHDDLPKNPAAPAGLFVGGVLISIFANAALGIFWFVNLYPDFIYWSRPLPPLWSALLPVLFFSILAAIGGVASVALLRHSRRRYLLMGMLSGLAIAALTEGFCFANP